MSIEDDAWNRAAWVLVAFFGIGLSLAIGFLITANTFDPSPHTLESNLF
jgi:hypothetical protein